MAHFNLNITHFGTNFYLLYSDFYDKDYVCFLLPNYWPQVRKLLLQKSFIDSP